MRHKPPRNRKPEPMLSVEAPEDIAYLMLEHETLTGQSGRTFVIAGADRLVYRLHWQPFCGSVDPILGLVIERLGSQGQVLDRQHLLPSALRAHSLVEAQAVGQLFTPPVQRAR